MGLAPGPDGSVYALVNHEQPHVPFQGKVDFVDSTVSQLQLDLAMGGVLGGSVPVPEGAPYGPDPSVAPNRQAGYAVRLDVATGEYAPMAGAGRMNHENTVVIPGGWDELALLTTDDTFSAPASQLYLYTAGTSPT